MCEKDKGIEAYEEQVILAALQSVYKLANGGDSPIVEGAYVTCNQSLYFLNDKIMAYAGVKNYDTCNGAVGLRESDIVLKPDTFGLCKVTEEACKPEIEEGKWQECDQAHRVNGEPGVTMNSYMVLGNCETSSQS